MVKRAHPSYYNMNYIEFAQHMKMRTEQENSDIKEAAFKASKKSKQKGRQKEHNSNSDVSEDDEEVANFVKRLNKGIDSRYRGKLLLICFNCDGIGHFANNCPYKKKRNDEGCSKDKQTYKGKITTKKVFKKNLCTKEDISSSDEDEKSVTVRQKEFYSWQ
jgi:hypothetical protein